MMNLSFLVYTLIYGTVYVTIYYIIYCLYIGLDSYSLKHFKKMRKKKIIQHGTKYLRLFKVIDNNENAINLLLDNSMKDLHNLFDNNFLAVEKQEVKISFISYLLFSVLAYF